MQIADSVFDPLIVLPVILYYLVVQLLRGIVWLCGVVWCRFICNFPLGKDNLNQLIN